MKSVQNIEHNQHCFVVQFSFVLSALGRQRCQGRGPGNAGRRRLPGLGLGWLAPQKQVAQRQGLQARAWWMQLKEPLMSGAFSPVTEGAVPPRGQQSRPGLGPGASCSIGLEARARPSFRSRHCRRLLRYRGSGQGRGEEPGAGQKETPALLPVCPQVKKSVFTAKPCPRLPRVPHCVTRPNDILWHLQMYRSGLGVLITATSFTLIVSRLSPWTLSATSYRWNK